MSGNQEQQTPPVAIVTGASGGIGEATARAWVLVTGASSGFGAEFARQYAAQGFGFSLDTQSDWSL